MTEIQWIFTDPQGAVLTEIQWIFSDYQRLIQI